MSYVWRSILKGLELIRQGIVMRIGNGENVNIWTDPWIPRGVTRRVSCNQGHTVLSRVDLIDPSTGTWDKELVQDILPRDDAEIVLKIPIYKDMEDFAAWHYDSKGIFSVKSAYMVHVYYLRRAEEGSTSDAPGTVGWKEETWKRLWKLKCPPKVHHFLWRFSHNSHPVRRNLERRGMDLDTRCVVCSTLFEDGCHLFFKCRLVKERWRALELEDVRVQLSLCTSAFDVCHSILKLPSEKATFVVATLWCWWTERNKALPMKVDVPLRSNQHWSLPDTHVIKFNCDGAFSQNEQKGGRGCIARNNVGRFGFVWVSCRTFCVAFDSYPEDVIRLVAGDIAAPTS
ncbi:hypothetical protein BRADI_4g13676v3 [Brachypodium distachyon]|uniref:Reverse transcriptase zinc-binding domain-containing protein n=1 Tax=Brachypodium distachyon TaxID=15368 RepID=A0A2K2CMM1_BRADI|nr:hypothetical protein BRADI_4g13676v3 [Brachypodium distachyon]